MSRDHNTALQPGQKSETPSQNKQTNKQKSTVKYHFTPQLEWRSLKNLETTDAGEDVEKKEHFYTVGGSVN